MSPDIRPMMLGKWRPALLALGLPEEFLDVRQHGPCPMCGGKDRYRWTNWQERGGYICSQCGHGDGFTLAMGALGMSFRETVEALRAWLGEAPVHRPYIARTSERRPEIVGLTARCKRILASSATCDAVEAAARYLEARGLAGTPAKDIRAHAGVDYLRAGQGKSVELVGHYPALVGIVRDNAGAPVTLHLTYLDRDGSKAKVDAPRKLLSVVGDGSVAIRLATVDGDTMGIAEGIETALSASLIHGIPVWSALNAPLLARFTPPRNVSRLIVYADRDAAGMEAAWRLRDRLEGDCLVELALPKLKDWNDDLRSLRA